jgi:hypothetical protein
MPFAQETSLQDVFNYIKSATRGGQLPTGLWLRVDAATLRRTPGFMQREITLNLGGAPLATSLHLIANQLDMDAVLQDDGSIVFRPHADGQAPTRGSAKKKSR